MKLNDIFCTAGSSSCDHPSPTPSPGRAVTRHPRAAATVFEISGVIVPLQVQLDPVGATSHNTALFYKDDYVLFTF